MINPMITQIPTIETTTAIIIVVEFEFELFDLLFDVEINVVTDEFELIVETSEVEVVDLKEFVDAVVVIITVVAVLNVVVVGKLIVNCSFVFNGPPLLRPPIT